ncbi:MAG: hypothetical protein C0467_27170 [Planctomycetaceae bacterium]|nr:hypothetical protein [Planctomycetaceae bacterium]
MPPEPETEVILCPVCKHMLRVPLDWLGQPVQCPECKAMFRAPVRDGKGGLTEPQVISRPESRQPVARKPLDAMLLLPAFGLLFCGFAGMVVNARTAYQAFTNPAVMQEAVRQQLHGLRQAGVGKDDPEADRDRLDDERAVQVVQVMRGVLPAFALVSGVAFLGGVSIATRWNYRLAQLGCVAAAVNVPHLCCVPGSVAGLWALLMLSSEEGRSHFGK